MEELRRRLKQLRKKNIDSRMFIPEMALYQAMTRDDIIQRAMRSAKIDLIREEEIATQIKRTGAKIFAILVLTSQPTDVTKFMELNELHDIKLPFKTNALRDDIKICDAEEFEKKQWELLAPKFRHGTLNRRFTRDTIFPFISEKPLGQGGFGTVRLITLDPDHQKVKDFFQLEFALKELGSSKSHQRELENLAILNRLKHPNIVQLLSSYTYGDKHYLIFPLAPGGALDKLLTGESDAAHCENEILLLALVGLSSALEHVHDFFEQKSDLRLIGCHHDLRPRNVLVSGETFVLADFGISKFKTSTQDSATPARGGRDDYLAPECEDVRNGPAVIGRASDVWTFGCILVEIATYMIQGAKGVRDFADHRLFRSRSAEHHRFHHGPEEESESVRAWLAMLEQSDVTACAMLTKLARSMLTMNPEFRPKAREVTSVLRMITLNDLSMTTDELFQQARTRAESLDAVIEHNRFTAWRYAAKILEPDPALDVLGHEVHVDGVQFESWLRGVRKIRDWLQQTLKEDDIFGPSFVELTRLNDSLRELLDARQQEQARQFFRISMMDVGDESIAGQIESDDYTLSLDKEIRVRVALKRMTALVADHCMTNAPQREVPSDQVHISGSLGEHSTGELTQQGQSQRVLVEWRRYGDLPLSQAFSNKVFTRLNEITAQLSADKPVTMRALRCNGYYHDEANHAFGIIYDLPTPTDSICSLSAPVSLHGLISKTRHDMKSLPALDDKFDMAIKLAKSILEFHLVGWLHKNLTADNVAFFPLEGEIRDEWIQRPYIVGFNHSRPDDPLGFTEGISRYATVGYHHPRYRRLTRGYRTEYDYYSLGIILAEIGFWKPLDRIVNLGQKPWNEDHDITLRDRLPLLVQCMGRDYFAAVEACVSGDWSRADVDDQGSRSGKPLHVEFQRKVLDRMIRSFNPFAATRPV